MHPQKYAAVLLAVAELSDRAPTSAPVTGMHALLLQRQYAKQEQVQQSISKTSIPLGVKVEIQDSSCLEMHHFTKDNACYGKSNKGLNNNQEGCTRPVHVA